MQLPRTLIQATDQSKSTLDKALNIQSTFQNIRDAIQDYRAMLNADTEKVHLSQSDYLKHKGKLLQELGQMILSGVENVQLTMAPNLLKQFLTEVDNNLKKLLSFPKFDFRPGLLGIKPNIPGHEVKAVGKTTPDDPYGNLGSDKVIMFGKPQGQYHSTGKIHTEDDQSTSPLIPSRFLSSMENSRYDLRITPISKTIAGIFKKYFEHTLSVNDNGKISKVPINIADVYLPLKSVEHNEFKMKSSSIAFGQQQINTFTQANFDRTISVEFFDDDTRVMRNFFQELAAKCSGYGKTYKPLPYKWALLRVEYWIFDTGNTLVKHGDYVCVLTGYTSSESLSNDLGASTTKAEFSIVGYIDKPITLDKRWE